MKEKKLYNEQLKNSLLFYKIQLEKLNKCLCSNCIFSFIYGDTIVAGDITNKRTVITFKIPAEFRNAFKNNTVIKNAGKRSTIEYVRKQNNNGYDVYLNYCYKPMIAVISFKDYLTAKIKTLEEMVNYDEKR